MTSFYGEYRKKDIISDEEENRVSRANIDKWIFRLLLILIGFMPLIVLAHTKEVISPLISDVSVLTSGTKGDLFTYYKALIVLIITVITGLLLLAKIFFMDGKIRKTILNYFLGAFVFAIVMSTILSPNISIALNGQYNRSDGAIMWLCYITLMFIAMNINYPKKVVSYVMYSLTPFVIINLYIITMNFTGHDLMQNQWVQSFVTIFLHDGLNLNDGSQIVGTLNQWNYMSGMFGVMTVMYLAWAIIDKKWINGVIGTIIALASIAVILMSVSTSGFVTVLFMILPILIILIFMVSKKLKGVILLIVFITFSTMLLHVLAQENPQVWTESLGFFIDKNPYSEEHEVAEKKISLNSFNINNTAYANDRSFSLPEIPKGGISAGTGRVYIWGKVFDLLSKRPIAGYGLDSLMYNFPHNNIDARAGIGSENVITDKPHNIFLGVFYGTGLLGFIALISILVFIISSCIKLLFKKVDNEYIVLGMASLAYFTQGMFNDSLPGTSGVIWVIMGIMFAQLFKEKDIERN